MDYEKCPEKLLPGLLQEGKNHLWLTALRQKSLNAEYSPQDVIDLCRNIVKVNLDNKQSFISETTQKTKDFLKGLGVDLFRNN